jgi:hypothetical protein
MLHCNFKICFLFLSVSFLKLVNCQNRSPTLSYHMYYILITYLIVTFELCHSRWLESCTLVLTNLIVGHQPICKHHILLLLRPVPSASCAFDSFNTTSAHAFRTLKLRKYFLITLKYVIPEKQQKKTFKN